MYLLGLVVIEMGKPAVMQFYASSVEGDSNLIIEFEFFQGALGHQ